MDYQYVKLVDGTADSTAKIGGDATNGLDVDVTRTPASAAGRVRRQGSADRWHHGCDRPEPRRNDALNVAIVDGSGAQVTSFAGSGGTSATDDADFTPASTAGTPIMGVYQSSPTSVTDNDMGIVGIDQPAGQGARGCEHARCRP